MTTPGKAHCLRVNIKTENVAPVADGSDMIPVYIIVCDQHGSRVYDSNLKVNIRVLAKEY